MNSLSASQPASVTIWDNDGLLTIGIADPTQKQSSITVVLLGENLAPTDVNTNGTVTVIEGGLAITVEVQGALGATVLVTAQDLASEAATLMAQAEEYLGRDLKADDITEGEALLAAMNELDEGKIPAERKDAFDALRNQLEMALAQLDE